MNFEHYDQRVSDSHFESDEKRGSAKRQFVEWVSVVGIALVVAIFIRLFFVQQFYISGPSMETTMFSDNRVLVNKLAFRVGEIDRGDVVVFDRATMNGTEIEHDDLIKRVIGIGGERVAIKNCVVYVDGEELAELYLPKRDTTIENLGDRCGVVNMDEIKLDTDEIFLMGDNRPESFDSRMFGAINKNLVIGQAFVLIWPPTKWRGL